MGDPLQELIDKQALQELVLSYCRACDRRDFVLLRTLYHDDAVDEHGAMFCGSADEYVAWLADPEVNKYLDKAKSGKELSQSEQLALQQAMSKRTEMMTLSLTMPETIVHFTSSSWRKKSAT